MTMRDRLTTATASNRARIKAAAVSAYLVLLIGCGGGGGGTDPQPPPDTGPDPTSMPPPDTAPPPGNQAPVADDTVVELIDWAPYEGVLPGSDPDGDSLRFEIYESFAPFVLTNSATGAYSYDPLRTKRSGTVTYRVVDEHGLVDFATITFLHNTELELEIGECPRETLEFGEPVARVWTHPDDSVLFVGFGSDTVVNVKRYQFFSLGQDFRGPELELLGTVLGETNKLLVDPDDPSVMYALSFARDLYISHDTGRSFEYYTGFSPSEPVLDMAVTGGRGGALWVVTERGVYVADKDSLEFRVARAFDEATASSDHSIAVHPDRPERLLVSGPDTLLRTEDSGTTWAVLPSAPTFRLVIDPHTPNRVYSNSGGSVYISIDFGTTWQFAGFNGFDNDMLVADPFRPGRLYVAPWNLFPGLFASEDFGDSFEPVEGISERVRATAFTSSGGMYVTQDQSIRCLSQFERPLLPANDNLSLNLRIEDSGGQPVAEQNLLAPVFARLDINNFAGGSLNDVTIDIWLEAPGNPRFALHHDEVSIGPEGTELLIDLPSPHVVGRYRVVASVDPSDDAPVGAIGWFVAISDPPESGGSGEFAVLSSNTLWLNYAHPWFPIATEVGERRRTILDVENEGPDTARNVTVIIGTGSSLRVDSVGPVYLGQTVNCYSNTSAETCELGDLAAGSTASLELYVTPLTQLSAVPVSVNSDTPDHGFLSGGLDLVTELSGPTEIAADTGIGYSITVTNTGDEQAESGRIQGAIGPWPAMTGAHGVTFSDSACSIGSGYPDEDVPLTYTCTFWFLKPGERFVVDIDIEPPITEEVVHVVDAIGFPDNFSSYWFELFRGNNLAGRVTTQPAPP